MTARNARGNGGNCNSPMGRKGGVDPAGGVVRCQGLEGRPGKLPLSIRREIRNLVGMRLRPEEDALAWLLPFVMG